MIDRNGKVNVTYLLMKPVMALRLQVCGHIRVYDGAGGLKHDKD